MKFLTLAFSVVLVSIDLFGQQFPGGNSHSYVGKSGIKYVSRDWYDNIPEQEPSSEMHRNNIGKIVFSKDKILFENEDPSKLENTFTTADNIYGRAYLICSPANDTLLVYEGDEGSNQLGNRLVKGVTKRKIQVARGLKNKYVKRSISWKLYINGKLSNWTAENATLDNESVLYTTRQLWLVPKSEDEQVSKYWLEIVDALPNGKNNIRVEYVVSRPYESIRPLAVGEFTLIKSENDVVSTGLGFADLEEGRKDPQLEREVIKIMNQTFEKKGWEGNIEKVKFRTDWIASYVGPYDNRKKIREIRFYLYTTHNKRKCQIEEFTVAQGHNGSAFSGPIFYRRVIPSSKQRVDCE